MKDKTVQSCYSLRHLSDNAEPTPLLCKLFGHKKHWLNKMSCSAIYAKISIFRCDREDTYFLQVTEQGLGMNFTDQTTRLQIKKTTYLKIDEVMNRWDGSQKSSINSIYRIGEILAHNLQWIHLGYTTDLSYLFQKYGEPAYEKYQGGMR